MTEQDKARAVLIGKRVTIKDERDVYGDGTVVSVEGNCIKVRWDEDGVVCWSFADDIEPLPDSPLAYANTGQGEVREALECAVRDLTATYEAAKAGKPIEISIGQFRRLERMNAALAQPNHPPAQGEVEEQAYQIGKEEGFSDAVQRIDLLTGGDGEYFASTIPGRGCPDPETMIKGIVARFEERVPPARGEGQPAGSGLREAATEARETLRALRLGHRVDVTGAIERLDAALSAHEDTPKALAAFDRLTIPDQGARSLSAMGLSYYYDAENWEGTYDVGDLDAVGDWLEEEQGCSKGVREVSTLIEGPLLYAGHYPIGWVEGSDPGDVDDWEVRFFHGHDHWARAVATAKAERALNTHPDHSGDQGEAPASRTERE